MQHRVRFTSSLIAALCVVLLVRSPVLAHATLARSTPADGAHLSAAPQQVELYFSEHLVQNRTGTFAIVLGPAGQQVSDEARIDGSDGVHLIVPLHGQLDAGSYIVFWKTTSDDDGGVSFGNFAFTVGTAPVSSSASGALPGQVLIPDQQRSRALTSAAPQASATPGWPLAIGLGSGALLGSVGTLLWLRLRGRRRSTLAVAHRARRE